MPKLLWPVDFGPSFSPEDMLKKGVFEGRYIESIKTSGKKPPPPASWFKIDKVLSGSKAPRDEKINFYGVKSRQPLSVWKENGWLTKESPYGWYQWYVHFYLGRRDIMHGDKLEDQWQIGRWRSFVARHMGQVAKGCKLGDKECRPVQRQGLLQWGWDSQTQLFGDKVIQANAKRLAKETGCELVTMKEFIEHYSGKPAMESLYTFDW